MSSKNRCMECGRFICKGKKKCLKCDSNSLYIEKSFNKKTLASVGLYFLVLFFFVALGLLLAFYGVSK